MEAMNKKQELIIWIVGLIIAVSAYSTLSWYATFTGSTTRYDAYSIGEFLKIAVPVLIVGGLMLMSFRRRS